MLLAAFAPGSKEVAIFYLIAVICLALSTVAGVGAGRRAGGSVSLIGLGLAFFVFPSMWNAFDAAF